VLNLKLLKETEREKRASGALPAHRGLGWERDSIVTGQVPPARRGRALEIQTKKRKNDIMDLKFD
jgi:hypothetical protein